MTEARRKLLIVEDDLDIADMLNAYFCVQGYDVVMANWGEDGVRSCQEASPDLVILDIRLPDIDGYEVARRLRSNRRTMEIPIIFLTDKRDRDSRLQGLELGAIDYITKPFDVQELRLRVRNTLRRTEIELLSNPVTGLPEGALVEERLRDCLQRIDWALLVISLQNLDVFREAYGFVASDDVLRAVSFMVQNAVREYGGQSDFLGHLGVNEFLLLTTPEHAASLRDHVRMRVEQSLGYFYPIKDRERPVLQGKYLAVKIGSLTPGEGVFPSTDDLKKALLDSKK